MSTLGERIKKLRLEQDLTQEDVINKLEKLGISINRISYSRWENDKQEPTLTPVIGLARIFGVSA